MNNWHDEFMAEYHRRRILEDIEQIRLEQSALRSRAYRPGFYARAMFNIASWMISAGQQLRRRYTRSSPVDEVPSAGCSKKPTGSFAH